MRIRQHRWHSESGWDAAGAPERDDEVDLVLAFGSKEVLAAGQALPGICAAYPDAAVVGCSTAGEIAGVRVSDHSLVATAVTFEHSTARVAQLALHQVPGSYEAGRRLAMDLPAEGLAHVLVLADGTLVNGSALVRGLNDHLPQGVQTTGGLAGDGERFEETLVLVGGEPRPGLIAAVGLYGERLRIGFGSLGGWDPFGPDRLITRSSGNVLFELDGKSALGLYKNYLGEYAGELPASALLFPLALRREGNRHRPVVRTVLSVDDAAESMTFAGDMPQGEYARFMKANFERLIDGATLAARSSYEILGGRTPELALLISCVGRRMVLKQRTEEEVESVREVLGDGAVLSGFYSYGEISPFTPSARCELHNQTMTITTLSEL